MSPPEAPPMPLTRRQAILSGLLSGLGGAAAIFVGRPVMAGAAYPKPTTQLIQPHQGGGTIQLILPSPGGGTTDLLARLIADQIKSGLGATVIVENKPGAATTIGAEQ